MQKIETETWGRYYRDIGIPDEIAQHYLEVIKRLSASNVPVIFDFEHLAALLSRTTKYLASAINNTSSHYREFSIPKRNGSRRLISAPYPALLECQQWIKTNVLESVLLHPASRGFIRGQSILTNAQPHCNSGVLLKLDLKNFFPSIPIKRVIRVFQNFGYPRNVSYYLAALCCLDGRLPQGAATSPALSNIIAKRLDARLHGLASKHSLSYTRYADDLTFSGDRIGTGLLAVIQEIIASEGFTLNEEKIRLMRGKGSRIVTGVSVGTSQKKVPRLYKREIRKQVHFIRKFGYLSHASKLRIKNPAYLASLLGKINFCLMIEPECDWLISAKSLVKSQIDSRRTRSAEALIA